MVAYFPNSELESIYFGKQELDGDSAHRFYRTTPGLTAGTNLGISASDFDQMSFVKPSIYKLLGTNTNCLHKQEVTG